MNINTTIITPNYKNRSWLIKSQTREDSLLVWYITYDMYNNYESSFFIYPSKDAKNMTILYMNNQLPVSILIDYFEENKHLLGEYSEPELIDKIIERLRNTYCNHYNLLRNEITHL